jgi:diguanylate cyclase (GGDEF)-like protein
VRVTVSAGVATCVPGESAEALIARADSALYQAKDAGRNCFVMAN